MRTLWQVEGFYSLKAQSGYDGGTRPCRDVA
jgi:hypothetical protein